MGSPPGQSDRISDYASQRKILLQLRDHYAS